MSLGAGLGRLKGRAFRIGHLGDFNELMLIGTLGGVELGLEAAGVPFCARWRRRRTACAGAAATRTAGAGSGGQRPVNRGGRLARNADTPSGSPRSHSRPRPCLRSGPCRDAPAATARASRLFAARIVSGAFRAIAAASSATAWSRSAAPARRVTTTAGRRFVDVEEPPGDQQILRPRDAEVLDEARAVRQRQARCRACARSGRRSARSASRRAGRTRARWRSRRRPRCRPPARWSARRRARAAPRLLEALFVHPAVLAGRKRRELADVRARAEDAAAAANHERAQAGLRVHAIAGLDERVVHLPGHGVAGLGPIDREAGDGAVDVEGGHVMSEARSALAGISRAGRHAGDGRSVLRDATIRHGRGRDQGRAARGRPDAPHGRARGHATAPDSPPSTAASAASSST